MGGMVSLFGAIPRAWVQWYKPMASALSNLDGCGERIKELKRESEDNMTPSVFQTALHPKPEKGHPALSTNDLAADALVMFTAGTDTTAHALVTGTWNLMNNPEMLKQLQTSLKEAIPDPNEMNLDWTALEKIGYLVSLDGDSIIDMLTTIFSSVQSSKNLSACPMACPARSPDKCRPTAPTYADSRYLAAPWSP
jgi:hypothetical protein